MTSTNGGRNPLFILIGFALLGAAAVLLIFGGDLLAPAQNQPTFNPDAAAFSTPVTSAAAPILSEVDTLEVGAAAPNFIAADLDGNPVELSELQGQPVILNFWATWCAPCRLEMPELEATYKTYQDDGLVILAINREETPDVIRPFFYDEMGLTFTPLIDETGLVANLYTVLVMPTTYFVNAEGEITAIHRGPLTQNQLEDYLALTFSHEG
ncbi:MAG: redoxin domain-containing protein [Chloroflexi bacterium]|nr:redoxin domain-containing protein [Chloroflexota bacterium]MBP8058788.1 redoxin domain-containing protein [Chloroflexota bacterium]